MTKQKKLILGFFVVLMVSMCTATDTVQAKKRNRMNRWEREHANATPWNGMYHHQSHNTPLAIIVPPFIGMGCFQECSNTVVPPVPTEYTAIATDLSGTLQVHAHVPQQQRRTWSVLHPRSLVTGQLPSADRACGAK